MDLTQSEKTLIKDYIFYHYHAQSNTNPEDFRRFNYLMFRALKLNLIYTLSFSALIYHFLHRSKRALFRGYVRPGYTAVILGFFSVVKYTSRAYSEIYSEEALLCAKKYEIQVEEYNDHHRRIYGNK